MRERLTWPALLLLTLAAACGDDADPGQDPPTYPNDHLLRLNHIQVAGTHNSYHIDTKSGIPGLDYTHAPIPTQLGSQGVRQLELDIQWDMTNKLLRVYHIPVVDQLSTCDLFTDCLAAVKGWSDKNRAHLPVVILVESKVTYKSLTEGTQAYSLVEADLLKVFPRDRLITPDHVRGSHATLNDAIVKEGWPTLDRVRGKVLVALLGGDGVSLYTSGDKHLKGRPMFVTGGAGKPYSALLSFNSSDTDETKIRQAAEAGYLIRARADSPGDEDAKKNNTKKREAALRAGAHLVSTDYPAKVPGIDYVMKIPGGTPARCNPITAPPTCKNADLE